MYFNISRAVLMLSLISCTSCKKFVEIENPSTSLTGETVFNSEPTATSAITSIYGRMISASGGFASGNTQSLGYLTALSADELQSIRTESEFRQFNENSLNSSNSYISSYLWNEVYQYIYSANEVIENIHTSMHISLPIQNQLEGEALFIRAFCHFYLTNIFGDVPLVLTTDHEVNRSLPRTETSKVYTQVITDLEKAVSLLSENYINFRNETSIERTRPNRMTAQALLARVYLYTGQWQKAEQTSSLIIADPKYQLNTLDQVFLKNSTEAIWQLQPVAAGLNTWEGNVFIQPVKPLSAVISSDLLSAFEADDQRAILWIGYGNSTQGPYAYPYKYKAKGQATITEYSMVFRLAEQYLIRAEARAQLNDIFGSQDDINTIRTRAGLPDTDADDQASLIAAILHERQTELFTEWGHRWLDLKRSGKIDSILSVVKGDHWESDDKLYPIPQSDREKNAALTQNHGY